MSTKIRPVLEVLVHQELEDANTKFSPFHSTHEGWGVIQEERQETEEALSKAIENLDHLWRHVRQNNTKKALQFAARTRECFIDAALEAIQTAAMAQKFLDSVTDP